MHEALALSASGEQSRRARAVLSLEQAATKTIGITSLGSMEADATIYALEFSCGVHLKERDSL